MIMKEDSNKVIIWGGDNYNTLAMIRAIGNDSKFSVDCIILGKSGYAVKSKYCHNFWETENIDDGYSVLMSKYANTKHKPIILTPSDEIIAFIDSHQFELKEYFIIPGTDTAGMIEQYNDKNRQTELAQKLGIDVPISKCIKWNSDISDLEYPCFIKPSHLKSGHKNEFKFKLCADKKELAKTLKLVNHDSEFIAQQYIKREKDLLVYGARMWDDNVVFAGSLETERFATGQGSSFGKVCNGIPDSIDSNKLKCFLEMINYHGIFSFEFGLCNGKAYFFEVNLRNDATSNYFYQSGANIPLAYAYSCIGLDYNTVCYKVQKENYYIDDVFDLNNVFSGNISIYKYRNDLTKATVYKYYDKTDINPWLAVKKHRFITIAKDLVVQKFRPYIVYLLDLRKK